MNLHKAQQKIVNDKHRFRVVCCGRRFGKTLLSIQEMLGCAVHNDQAQIAYIAPTYQQARDICWNQLKRDAGKAISKINESRLEIQVHNKFGNTSSIWLRGWESIDTLRGQFFNFLVLDEVASYRNFNLMWEEVLRPTLTDKKGDGLFISTPKGFNHFYDLFGMEGSDADYKSFHFTSYDNPHIDREEVDKAKAEMTDDKFSQEYMADFKKMEGLVYPEFSREKHLIPLDAQLPDFKEIISGVDFGFTNPASAVKIGVTRDDHYYILEEWYKTKQTTSQIVDTVKQMKPNRVYPDPAEPDRILELEEGGLYCRDVSKDVENGINRVREFLKQGRLYIMANCKYTIWEFETYAYPENAYGKFNRHEKEYPIKENDHLMDAIRYAIYSHTPLSEIQQPDFSLYGEDFT